MYSMKSLPLGGASIAFGCTRKSKKYFQTAQQDIWIYYRDIGLMDKPVEPSDGTEAESEEYELMDVQATILTA